MDDLSLDAIIQSIALTLENVHDGVLVFDRQLQIIFFNQPLEEMTGLSHHKVLHKKVGEVLTFLDEGEGPLKIITTLKGHKCETKGQSFKIAQTQKAGYYDAFYSPLILPSGQVVSGMVVIRDITEKKISDLLLHESERRFRKMADYAPVYLWMSETNGDCNYFNQSWLDFTGRTMEQEKGVGWAEGIYFEDFQLAMDTYIEHFNKQQSFEMEYRLRRADGVYRWILDRGIPRYDLENNFVGFIGSCIDITERKALEQHKEQLYEQLKITEKKYLDLYENAPDMYATISSQDLTIVECNQTLAQTLGRAKEELIGQSVTTLFYPHDQERAIINYQNFLTSPLSIGSITAEDNFSSSVKQGPLSMWDSNPRPSWMLNNRS